MPELLQRRQAPLDLPERGDARKDRAVAGRGLHVRGVELAEDRAGGLGLSYEAGRAETGGDRADQRLELGISDAQVWALTPARRLALIDSGVSGGDDGLGYPVELGADVDGAIDQIEARARGGL